MKKIFTLALLAIMGMGNAMAEEVTLKYSGSETTNMLADGSNEAATVGLDDSAWSVIADKGKASNAPGLNKAGDIRLYWNKDGNNTITVSSLTNATISSIAITFTGDSYSNASVTVDGNAVTGADGVYSINSTSFVLGNANTSNAQVRISQIVITYSGGGAPVETIKAPKFSVASGTYYEPQTVELTCETEGAKILYTIPDGSTDPAYTDDNNYTGVFYDGTPLTIRATTTIKAMAVKDGKTSNIVTATYTIAELEVKTLAEAQAAAKGDAVIVEGVVVASAAGGAVLSDGTDYLYYYNSNNALTVGQKVRMSGALGEYGGAKQMTNSATITELGTEEVTYPEPVVLSTSDFESIVTAKVAERKYVKFEGTLNINGNYFNIAIDGTETAVGSIVKPREDLTDLNGKKIVVTGYLMYVNNKYVYVVATSVVDASLTGITTTKTATKQNGAIYNIAGQMVNKGYKGLVIQNGKKFFQK